MGQMNNGSTDNANVSMNGAGLYQFYFDDPMDMYINLDNANGVVIDGSAKDDLLNLNNSSNLTILGNAGNDIFSVGASAGGLNGNIIKGQTGYNFVTTNGSNTDINLAGSSGITAIVGKFDLTGQSVEVSLNQFNGSALKNGANRAVAAVIGTGGTVNLTVAADATFVGVINGAGQGFDASGSAITGAALTALMADVTSDSAITGNLASLYSAAYDGGIHSSGATEVQGLNAYVFQQGGNYYTLWSDGVVTAVSSSGASSTLYQPAQAAPTPAPVFHSVTTFNKAGGYAVANVYTDIKGNPDLLLAHGGSNGSSAIDLVNNVAGVSVHGDSGPQGMAYFGLGGSGGNNQLYAPIAGAEFDLQNSTALQDVLHGGVGFDVVKFGPNGGDVDLTANNATTSTAATSIDAVVGSATAVLAGIGETVELSVNTLHTVKAASGVPSAVFEALLGSSSDVLTLSGTGLWEQISQFAPGSTPPANASALINASELDALYHGNTYTAEANLTGYLFEKVTNSGHVLEYLTVYTDATLVNGLAAPANPVIAHADLHFA